MESPELSCAWWESAYFLQIKLWMLFHQCNLCRVVQPASSIPSTVTVTAAATPAAQVGLSARSLATQMAAGDAALSTVCPRHSDSPHLIMQGLMDIAHHSYLDMPCL